MSKNVLVISLLVSLALSGTTGMFASSDSEKADTGKPLSDASPSLQEKVKKELDQVDASTAAMMLKDDKSLEAEQPLKQLEGYYSQIKSNSFPTIAHFCDALGSRYYLRAATSRNYSQAVTFNEWLLQSCKAYQGQFDGSRVLIRSLTLRLAGLYCLKGDYPKAEYYCKQYFVVAPAGDAEAQKGRNSNGNTVEHTSAYRIETHRFSDKPAAELKAGDIKSIQFILAHVYYAKGNYKQAADYLAKSDGKKTSK